MPAAKNTALSFIFILFNLIHLSSAQAVVIDVYPKNLLLFTENEHNTIKENFKSEDGSREKNEKFLQNVLTQVVRTMALSKCREQICDKNTRKECVDFTDFELEILPISPKSERKKIDIVTNLKRIAIYPNWQSHKSRSDPSKQGFYLTKVSCTDQVVNPEMKGLKTDGVILLHDDENNLVPPPNWKRQSNRCDPVLDSLLDPISKEAQDWGEISIALAKGAGTSMKEGYADLKDTLRYCPKEAMQSCFYRGMSLVSFGASAWATERARKLDENMKLLKASQGKSEPLEYRAQRLMETFQRTKDQFTREDQSNIASMFAGIPSRVQYDNQGDLPKLLDRIEDVLKLPKKSRFITSEEGEELRKELSRMNYPPEFIEHAYTMAALMAVTAKYNKYIPIRPFFIKGSPGVGKTSFIAAVARVLKLPICMIRVNDTDRAGEELFGSYYDHKSGTSHKGLLADCFTNQRDADGNPIAETVNNPLMVFDELDRVLNSEKAGAIKAQLLGLFNNSERDQKFQAAGLQNVTIDLSRAPKFVLGNNYILSEDALKGRKNDNSKNPKDSKDSKGSKEEKKISDFDPAFKSRMNVLEMEAVGKKEKKLIAEGWKDVAMESFGIEKLDSDIAKNHDKILELDQEPGLRTLKSLVFENIAIQAARNLGWKMNVIDVEKAYSEVQ